MTVDDEPEDYLGCKLVFNKDLTKAWMGQPHLIKKLVKKFGEKVKKMKEYETPGTPGFGVLKIKEKEELLEPEKQKEYRSGTGMLLYLVKHT